jgi:hypothetical protein
VVETAHGDELRDFKNKIMLCKSATENEAFMKLFSALRIFLLCTWSIKAITFTFNNITAEAFHLQSLLSRFTSQLFRWKDKQKPKQCEQLRPMTDS